MASPFKELELLMDHNTSVVTPSSPPFSSGSILPLCVQQQEQDGTQEGSSPSLDQEHHQHQHSSSYHSSFATLSLSFSPVISPTILPNPKAYSNPRSASSPSLKPALASAPLKKNGNKSSPLMPAIASAAVAPDVTLTTPSIKTRKGFTAFPDYQRLPDKNNNFRDPSNGAAIRRASIVWFRNDLRCHDNEALAAASKDSLSVLPVYCFDPRDYGKSSSGFDKTGPYRAKFLLECVSNLRENLRKRGSDLAVRIGKPEEVLVTLAKSIGADAIYAHQEVSCEEVLSEKKVSAALQEEGVDVKFFWGSTLFHVDDLPFKLDEMPITYSGFREKVQNITIRQAVDAPKQMRGLPARGGVKLGDIPTLEELGLRPVSVTRQDGTSITTSALIGGEAEALNRLKSFVGEHLQQYNGKSKSSVAAESLYGSNFSCKISPWLAMGCLSPRRMFEDLLGRGKRAGMAASSVASESGLNWLVFELLWRDFFRFITKKYAAGKQSTDVVTASPVPMPA